MGNSKPEEVHLGRVVPLKRNKEGQPLFMEMPLKVASMEIASGELFEALGKLTVAQLKSLRPSGPFVLLIESLINVRQLMGGEGSDG